MNFTILFVLTFNIDSGSARSGQYGLSKDIRLSNDIHSFGINKDGKIFGLTKNPTTSIAWTFLLDPSTESFTYLKEIPSFTYHTLSTTAYDPEGQTIYVLGINQDLFIFNSTTGELISRIFLSNDLDDPILISEGNLVGFGKIGSSTQRYLMNINLSNGTCSVINKLEGIDSINVGFACYDKISKIIYRIMESNILFLINSSSGSIISQCYLSTQIRNPFINSLGELYGLYKDTTTQQETLQQINCTTGQTTNVCYIQGLSSISPGCWTFDYNSNYFYQFGYPKDTYTEPHLYLIQAGANSNPFGTIDGFSINLIGICGGLGTVLYILFLKNSKSKII